MTTTTIIEKQDVSIKEIKNYLVSNNIHPSYHRIKIMEYLLKNRVHPSVENIYIDLLKEIPTFSKTTVYNTLKLFEKNGVVLALSINENELRYDCNINPHVHFKCEVCGNIYDIFTEVDCFKGKMIDGHKINSQQLYLKGICKNCQK